MQALLRVTTNMPCMYIYMYVYVCMYVCMSRLTYLCMYVCRKDGHDGINRFMNTLSECKGK